MTAVSSGVLYEISIEEIVVPGGNFPSTENFKAKIPIVITTPKHRPIAIATAIFLNLNMFVWNLFFYRFFFDALQRRM